MSNQIITAEEIQRNMLESQLSLIEHASATVSKIEEEPERLEYLKSLGFTRSANNIDMQLRQSSEILSLEEKYKFEYPGLKFITERVMNQVCYQYGLTLGHVSRYLGKMPMWALEQIKKNQHLFVQVKMEPIFRLENNFDSSYGTWTFDDGTYIAGERNNKPKEQYRNNLMIAAPRDDMHLERFEARGRMGNIVHIETRGRMGNIVHRPVSDPIVSLQVKGGFIVLAAWDKEGNDPRVFNVENN